MRWSLTVQVLFAKKFVRWSLTVQVFFANFNWKLRVVFEIFISYALVTNRTSESWKTSVFVCLFVCLFVCRFVCSLKSKCQSSRIRCHGKSDPGHPRINFNSWFDPSPRKQSVFGASVSSRKIISCQYEWFLKTSRTFYIIQNFGDSWKSITGRSATVFTAGSVQQCTYQRWR